jgi:hypothetical protein
MSKLRLVAAISGVYDGFIGVMMLLGRPFLSRLFDVPLPQPPIHADLNGIFLLAVAIGYIIPYGDPERGRGYLWVMGPLLKGGGAVAFVLDHFVRHSPRSFLLFALSDGLLALWTWWALATNPVQPRSAKASRYN